MLLEIMNDKLALTMNLILKNQGLSPFDPLRKSQHSGVHLVHHNLFADENLVHHNLFADERKLGLGLWEVSF
jgi:hypothetical protein